MTVPVQEERPPIFDERNRRVWEVARRVMIYLLKELDKWYGWNTFHAPLTQKDD